mmetsp:Transcript_48006/g.120805  ORF Transcript_48006/g.120805 Transcript_48006/m.120805 type:complete len:281 (-) Transcript_48006:1559-2401(-)
MILNDVHLSVGSLIQASPLHGAQIELCDVGSLDHKVGLGIDHLVEEATDVETRTALAGHCEYPHLEELAAHGAHRAKAADRAPVSPGALLGDCAIDGRGESIDAHLGAAQAAGDVHVAVLIHHDLHRLAVGRLSLAQRRTQPHKGVGERVVGGHVTHHVPALHLHLEETGQSEVAAVREERQRRHQCIRRVAQVQPTQSDVAPLGAQCIVARKTGHVEGVLLLLCLRRVITVAAHRNRGASATAGTTANTTTMTTTTTTTTSFAGAGEGEKVAADVRLVA